MALTLPMGSFETRRANALRNAGGDENSPLFQQWMSQYGQGGTNPTGAPFGNEANAINQFMTTQAQAPYLANLPNYAAMVGQRSGNITSQLQGQLPQDVMNVIAQGAAERGIAGGNPGGPNANAAYLRSLGLTSLDMQNQGSQGLTQAIADTPVPELWNPAQLWVPSVLGQQEQTAAQNAITQGTQLAQNAARINPWTSRDGYSIGNTYFGARNPLALF